MVIRRRALASLSGDSCGDVAAGVGNIFLGHSAMATSGGYSGIDVSDTDIVDFASIARDEVVD
jgi:ubiquinone/menaquinone biosynthesis C-methylase UbiE